MWRLISRLVDTPSLCLYGIFSCFKAYEYWHVDYLVYILHVPYYILNLVIMCVCIYLLMFVCIYFVWLTFFFFSLWCMFGCYVHLRCSHVDYIDWFSYLLLHSDSSYCIIILFSFICIFSFLYISFILVWLILSIVYYLVYLNILFILVIYLSYLSCFLLSLCGYINDIPVICMTGWCMTALLLCDACISCLCGIHIYPLTFNSLVSIDFVSLNLVFDMRLVTLFALRPS